MAVQRNHSIQVGDIFSRSSTDETGSSTGFYQVTALQGKDLVVLRPIQAEHFVDESCKGRPGASPVVRLRPVKDAFPPPRPGEDGQAADPGILTRYSSGGRNLSVTRVLPKGEARGVWWVLSNTWRLCQPGETGYDSGYDAVYDLERMAKGQTVF